MLLFMQVSCMVSGRAAMVEGDVVDGYLMSGKAHIQGSDGMPHC